MNLNKSRRGDLSLSKLLPALHSALFIIQRVIFMLAFA
ncbi:MAG: hypothetical protein JWR38_1485 [Mucilaginibacter sp.]|nr:hypothetical protein [Mucilaginibacter sp.]